MQLEKGAYIPEEPHEKHAPTGINPVPPFEPVAPKPEKDLAKSKCQEYYS